MILQFKILTNYMFFNSYLKKKINFKFMKYKTYKIKIKKIN